METPTRIAAIIPARMASTRFPGKPLLKIAGLPMVEHVRRRAVLAGCFSRVVVATCDREIADAVASFGGEALMTSPAHQVGTERVLEAVRKTDCTHVINVQGDEVLVLPSDLQKMAGAIREYPACPVWNAVAELTETQELGDISIVKGIVSEGGSLLYFSRHFSQFAPLGPEGFRPLVWIVGLLAYTRESLQQFQAWPKARTEGVESIEQMRFLENDVPVRAVFFSRAYPGINEPRELALVEKFLREDALQKNVLERILRG